MTKYVPRTTPFSHQSRATLRAARQRNYAFFFEPRCGKSKAALDTAGVHALAGRVRKVLIICPAIARDVWEEQLHEHYPYEYEAQTFTDEWMSSMRDLLAVGRTQFFIASREETFRRTRDSKGRYQRPKQEILAAYDPDMVILDESHEAQRPGGVYAQDAWRLVQRLRARHASSRDARTRDRAEKPQPWVLLLSGTPNPKGWRPLFAQFRIMDPTLWGTSIAQWDERHVVYGHGRRRWTIIRYNNQKRLEDTLRRHSFSISADEAGLANKVFMQRLRYNLPAQARSMYNDMVTEFVAEWEEDVLTAKNAGVKRIRLLQILGGYTTDGAQIHDSGVQAVASYARVLYEQGESLVVYSRFTPEVVALTDALSHIGFQTWRVDGDTSNDDRRGALAALKRPPRTPTAISAQVQALSQAVELVGAAEVAYYGVPDGWTQYFQTSRRVMGPNQKRPVRITFVTVPSSVHNVQLQSLKRKEHWHSTLMQNPRRYLDMLQ